MALTISVLGVRKDAFIPHLEIKPTAGEKLDKLAKEIIVQPREVVEPMKKLLGE